MKSIFTIAASALLPILASALTSTGGTFTGDINTGFSLKTIEDSTASVYYTVAGSRDTTYYINNREQGWEPFGDYLAAETSLKKSNPGKVLLPGVRPMSPLFDVSSVGTINSAAKSADGLALDGSTLIAQTADENYPGLMSTGTQTIAGAKTFSTSLSTPALTAGTGTFTGNTSVTGKFNVNHTDNTRGDINAGTSGVYTWKNWSRFMRFSTNGSYNDLESVGERLVINFGADNIAQDVSFFAHTETTHAQNGHVSIGTSDNSARLVVKGLTNTTSDYAIKAINSSNATLFSLRDDGQLSLPVSPVTSESGAYEVLTRNTLTGAIEKVSLSTIQLPDSSGGGGGNYIHNQTVGVQPGGFKISGDGYIHNALYIGDEEDVSLTYEIGQNDAGLLRFNYKDSGTPHKFGKNEFAMGSYNGTSIQGYRFGGLDLSSKSFVRLQGSQGARVEVVSPELRIYTAGVISNYGAIQHNNTADRTWHFPDSSGTIAMTSNLSGSSGYMSKFTANNTIGNSSIFEADGNIGIGTITPGQKLSVNGNIRAKEIKVEAANWPDYVFEESHKRLSLPELEGYIATNKHLPGIPSAAEVSESGVDLGAVNAKLLEKIEEITLYLIELKKDNIELQKRIEELEDK